MLITLLLTSEGVLSEPLLYLSVYFNRNRQRYYELLDRVRQEGDWGSGWNSSPTRCCSALPSAGKPPACVLQDLFQVAGECLRFTRDARAAMAVARKYALAGSGTWLNCT